MRIFKIKQDVINRITRKNESISVPRRLTVRTFVNEHDHDDRVIEVEYQDTFTIVDLDEFNNSWMPLISAIYDEEVNGG